MSVVVEAKHKRPESRRYQHIQRQTPVTSGPNNRYPNTVVEANFLHLNLRLRYASACSGLAYLALLSDMLG